MDNKDIIKSQLERYYVAIDNTRSQRQTIKKWCLTVWIAIVGAIITEKLVVSFWNQLILPCLSVTVFWFLEGITATHTLILEERAKRVENKLVDTENDSTRFPQELLYVTGHYFVPFGRKVRYFVASVFQMETVFLYYTALILLSILIGFVRKWL